MTTLDTKTQTSNPSIQVDTASKRFDQLIKEINTIYIDARNPQTRPTMEKKLQTYKKINMLVEESTQLLNKMEIDIQKLDAGQFDPSHSVKIDDWLELLSSNQLKMEEVIHIIGQLQAMSEDLPSEVEIVDNVDQEIIYEEEDVF